MSGAERNIFEIEGQEVTCNFVPKMDVEPTSLEMILPSSHLRENLDLPDISEPNIVRHFVNLASRNYGVDTGIYPLGSCTMKYNPKVNELAARLPGFAQIHPLQDRCQGALELLYNLARDLGEITGMAGFTTQPAAGAHGELVGLLIIKKYFETKGDSKRNKIIVPDSSHGTNPASATMAGFSIIELESTTSGEVPLDHLEFAMKAGDVAGIMLTNPNTLGLFDRNITEITRIVHEYGGLCYYDGANMNPMLGICRPGDMGFDIIHLNLHKSFATPHGGGGPGAGPVGVKEPLLPYLPEPCIFASESGLACRESVESIGRIRCFWGNFGVLVKAYSYIRALGADGLRKVGEISVLNANYLREKLKNSYHLPYDRICQHEFVLSDKGLPNEINTEDVAKRLLDCGLYSPTIYFPLIVAGAMMIEPTETESKESLDHFIEIMARIRKEAEESPELIRKAPQKTPIGRLDATLAARKPVLKE